jgi:hypothetical protein
MLSVLLGFPAAARADATIQGRVTDTTGSPLPAVTIEVRAASQPIERTTSGDDGRYVVKGLTPGVYEVGFELTGFVRLARRDVALAEGSVVDVDVTLYVSATATVVVTGRETFRSLASVSAAEDLIGVAETASSGVVTPAELEERARRRPAEVLESVPGVVVSQHSGEGKANQYYLRGFNLDHGTDLSISVAGMPVNLPTHGHGQGYADLNFLIPELVSGIQYRKGPYYADEGDFSAAGAIKVNYVNVLGGPLLRLEAGSYGLARALGAASPRVGEGHVLVAFEGLHNDGPWEHPDDLEKWNGLVRYSKGSATTGFSLTGLFYDASWNATDQIPRRAVDDGALDRFGAIDTSGGGRSHRAGAMFEWQRTAAQSVSRIEAYGFDYGLRLFSNFTYFLDDPENGDQFEQRDDRVAFGARGSQAWSAQLGSRHAVTTVGGQVRRDDIGAVGLYRTRARTRLATVREDEVGQTSGAVYGQVAMNLMDTVRMVGGMRADFYAFDVSSDDPLNSGSESAAIVNPKLSLILGPWRRTELYANAGGGFHSNDARGVTIRRDPDSGEPADPVDPLVRAKGTEFGIRTLAVDRLHMTTAMWGLWLGSELLFIGDAGTTEASRPSRRLGFEWDADYRATPSLTLEGSFAYSWARFTDDQPEGTRIPGAIEGVATAGVILSPPASKWSGSVRWRFFGPRPLVEDNSVRSEASQLLNAEVGYRLSNVWRLKADFLNLLDAHDADIDYFYTSRLGDEPFEGVDDIHFHPVEPFTFRIALVAHF